MYNSAVWIYLALCFLLAVVTQVSAVETFAFKIGSDIHASRIRQTSDDGYIICGTIATVRKGDALLLKLDHKGTVQWSRSFGGPETDFALDCFQTIDGAYIIAGNTLSFLFPAEAAHYDAFVAKLNSAGKPIWTRSFFGGAHDSVSAITPSPDGGVVVFGETYEFEAKEPENWTNLDLYLAKFDADGKLIWTRHFGTRGDDDSSAITATSDGGYLLAGWLLNGDGAFVAKSDSRGIFEWTRSFQEVDGFQGIAETFPGNYILTGTYHLV
jgi:hypothetical protein